MTLSLLELLIAAKNVEDKDETISKHENYEKELNDLKEQIELLEQENKDEESKLFKLEED